jgi:hypothetical protein
VTGGTLERGSARADAARSVLERRDRERQTPIRRPVWVGGVRSATRDVRFKRNVGERRQARQASTPAPKYRPAARIVPAAIDPTLM